MKFDVGINRNKLISFPNLANSPWADYLQIGQPLSLFNVLKYTGVDPLTGQYTFADLNHDGVIEQSPYPQGDEYKINLAPKADGGFGSDFSYKNLQLSVFFRFEIKKAPNGIFDGPTGGQMSNIGLNMYQNSWLKPGDVSEFGRFTTQEALSDNYFVVSDAAYTDASFIRLQNLALTYTLGKGVAQKIGINSCRIFIRGENLLLITKYNGIDPETPGFGGLPPTKIITGGVQFTL